MIPFTQPQDGEIVNLSQIVRVIDHTTDDGICVHFSDGKQMHYAGEAAKIIKGGVLMNRQIYEKGMLAVLQPSNIVTPAGGSLIQ